MKTTQLTENQEFIPETLNDFVRERAELGKKIRFARAAEVIIKAYIIEPSSYKYTSKFKINGKPEMHDIFGGGKLTAFGSFYLRPYTIESMIVWYEDIDNAGPAPKAWRDLHRAAKYCAKHWEKYWPIFTDILDDYYKKYQS